MPTNPYTTQTISNYNNSPPPDDGTTTSANQLEWAKHKTKLADPIKTLAENINSQALAAFAKTMNTDADEKNQISGSLAFARSELTLATDDSITPTRSIHTVDTNADASSDVLSVLATGSVNDGALVWLVEENSGRTVNVTDSSPATATAANITLLGGGVIPLRSTPTMFWHDAGTFYEVEGRGWALIESQTASSSASLDFTKGIDSTFDAFMLVLTGLRPATDGAGTRLRVSTDGGATFISTASYDYNSAQQLAGTAGVSNQATAAGSSSMEMAASCGAASEEGVGGYIMFSNPSSGSKYAHFAWELLYFDNAGTPVLRRAFGMGAYDGATTAINAVQVFASSGNLADGSVALYGLRK